MYRKNVQGWFKHLDFIILDLLVLELAFALATVTRNGPHVFHRNPVYPSSAVILAISSILFSIITENHKDILKRGYFREFISVLYIVSSTLIMILIYLFFVQNTLSFSRLVSLYYFVYASVLLYLGRILWKKKVIRSALKSENKSRLLIVTRSEMAPIVIGHVNGDAFAKYEIAGVFLTDRVSAPKEMTEGPLVIDSADSVVEYIKANWVDEVLICYPSGEKVPKTLLDELALMGIVTHQVLDLKSDRNVTQTVEKVAGYICLTESLRTASAGELLVKRLMDIAGGLVGILLTGVLFLFVAPCIYLTDPGPIFFSQIRIGKNGKNFRIYKFRSMYQDAEERKKSLMEKNRNTDGHMFKMDNDPRILGSGPDGTRHGIGWFIRKTSIDEFPQFWNVLKGDMSLVGTRPPLQSEVDTYKLHHYARLSIKPGITGLWQVSGRSNITDFEEVVALDLKYINNWSIGEDIRILIKTVGLIFTGDGAE